MANAARLQHRHAFAHVNVLFETITRICLIIEPPYNAVVEEAPIYRLRRRAVFVICISQPDI